MDWKTYVWYQSFPIDLLFPCTPNSMNKLNLREPTKINQGWVFLESSRISQMLFSQLQGDCKCPLQWTFFVRNKWYTDLIVLWLNILLYTRSLGQIWKALSISINFDNVYCEPNSIGLQSRFFQIYVFFFILIWFICLF